MQYLGNNHVGFDSVSLGFPSIKGCQAVVYHVQAGLFGLHDMKSGSFGEGFPSAETVVDHKSDAFVDWISRQENAASPGIALYGVINREHQYYNTAEGNQSWSDMLTDLAEKLHFDGPVYGARINSHVKKDDSVYVRFDNQGGSCLIGFKRWSKMEQVAGTEHSPSTQAVLKSVNPMTAAFDTTALSDTEYDDAKVVGRIDPNKGENLNLIAFKTLSRFA